jgi:hypothetical protein
LVLPRSFNVPEPSFSYNSLFIINPSDSDIKLAFGDDSTVAVTPGEPNVIHVHAKTGVLLYEPDLAITARWFAAKTLAGDGVLEFYYGTLDATPLTMH